MYMKWFEKKEIRVCIHSVSNVISQFFSCNEGSEFFLCVEWRCCASVTKSCIKVEYFITKMNKNQNFKNNCRKLLWIFSFKCNTKNIENFKRSPKKNISKSENMKEI